MISISERELLGSLTERHCLLLKGIVTISSLISMTIILEMENYEKPSNVSSVQSNCNISPVFPVRLQILSSVADSAEISSGGTIGKIVK